MNTKRTNWKYGLSVGLFGLLATAFALPTSRSIIIGFFETKYVEWTLTQLHPQNEGELFQAYSNAITLGGRHYSLFHLDGERIVHGWTRHRDGSLKTWANPYFERMYVRTISDKSAWSEDCTTMWSTGSIGDFRWRFQRWRIWVEGGASLVGGAIAGALGIWLIWLAVVGLFVSLLFLGKTTVTMCPVGLEHQATVHVVHFGGDAPHHLDDGGVAVPTPQDGWLVIWAMLFVVVVRDVRRITRGIRTMSTRAPPFRKESVMRRIIVILAAVVAWYPSPASADNVAVYLGEQLAGVGGAADVTIEREAVVLVPWSLLDGSKFEGLAMARYAPDPSFNVAIGPLVGSINAKDGATPYYGGEVRGRVQYRSTSFNARLAYRRVAESRMSQFANLGLEQSWAKLAVRASYQPLQKLGSWEQRVAGKITVPVRQLRFAVEVRTSLNGLHRTSALLEVRIPLKLQ